MCADPGDDKIPHGSWRKTYIFIYDNLFITRELNLLLVTVGNVWLGSSSLFCRSEKPRQFLNTQWWVWRRKDQTDHLMAVLCAVVLCVVGLLSRCYSCLRDFGLFRFIICCAYSGVLLNWLTGFCPLLLLLLFFFFLYSSLSSISLQVCRLETSFGSCIQVMTKLL